MSYSKAGFAASSVRQINLNVPGQMAVGSAGIRFYNKTGGPLTINTVTASLGTAATGSTFIVNLNINGVTAFTGGTNRPTISSGSFVSPAVTPAVVAIPVDAYLTVDIVQIGSTVPGVDLIVSVVASG